MDRCTGCDKCLTSTFCLGSESSKRSDVQDLSSASLSNSCQSYFSNLPVCAHRDQCMLTLQTDMAACMVHCRLHCAVQHRMLQRPIVHLIDLWSTRLLQYLKALLVAAKVSCVFNALLGSCQQTEAMQARPKQRCLHPADLLPITKHLIFNMMC